MDGLLRCDGLGAAELGSGRAVLLRRARRGGVAARDGLGTVLARNATSCQSLARAGPPV